MVLATLAVCAPAGAVRVRAPTYGETMGLLRAFVRDGGRLGLRQASPRITGMRVTSDGHYAAVFYVWLKTSRKATRAGASPRVRLLESGSGDYDIQRSTGGWKPDRAASERLRGVRLTLWDVTYSGSGMDSVDAFRHGDPQSSPNCLAPDQTVSAGASYRFDQTWSELSRGTGSLGSGKTSGHGTYSLKNLPGCDSGDGTNWSANNVTCSVDWSSTPAAPPVQARISENVDRHGNHEVRVFAPVPEPQGAGSDCAAPDTWIFSSNYGPVVPDHSILVPDSSLAGSSSFTVRVGQKHTESCFYLAIPSRCSEGITWTGSVRFTPSAYQGADRLRFAEGPDNDNVYGTPEGISRPVPPQPFQITDLFDDMLTLAGDIMYK